MQNIQERIADANQSTLGDANKRVSHMSTSIWINVAHLETSLSRSPGCQAVVVAELSVYLSPPDDAPPIECDKKSKNVLINEHPQHSGTMQKSSVVVTEHF